MPTPRLEPNPKFLSDMLWGEARLTAGMPFSPSGESSLKDVIRQGVDRMISQRRFDESPKAMENMRSFVQRMKNYAETQKENELDDKAVETALSLCGLWPFCAWQ